VLYQVVYRNPARPSQLAPGLSSDVDLVLAIAMAKDPADRFASAMEAAEALRSAWKGTLGPDLRVHAQTILAALPWGAAVREGSDLEMVSAG
jgi:serine/threonine-protein kinase